MTQRSMTQGPITQGILLFALPLMLGNLLQQMYNIADTWVVGRFLGAGRTGGGGLVLYPHDLPHLHPAGPVHGQRRGHLHAVRQRAKKTACARACSSPSVLIAGISLVLNVLVYLGLDGILWVLRVPGELKPLMKDVPRHHLSGHHGYLPVQLLRKPAARHRQLGGAAGVSGGVGGAERHSRPRVRAGAAAGA